MADANRSTKQCISCDRTLALADFRSSEHKLGPHRYGTCEHCISYRRNARGRTRIAFDYARAVVDAPHYCKPDEFWCIACHRYLPAHDGIQRKGRLALCRACKRDDRTRNPGKREEGRKRGLIRKLLRLLRARLPKPSKPHAHDAHVRAWKRTPEYRAMRQRQSYWRNPAATKQRVKRYKYAYPERCMAWADKRLRQTAELSDGTVTRQAVTVLLANAKRCPYCNKRLGDDKHIDHMQPVSKGGAHSLANLVVCCKTCNLAKSDKPFAEWLETLKDSSHAERLYQRLRGSPHKQQQLL